MTMIKNVLGQYPAKMTGVITFTGTVTGTFNVGETVTGGTSGMTAKVIKWNATTKELTVKGIAGNPAGAETVTSASGSAAVATITATDVGGVQVNTGGWNLRETPHGITRSKKFGTRTQVEVLIADRNLGTNRTDFATVATFTLTGGAWSSATTYDVSNGDAITFTIISSEPVRLPTGTTYAVTIGATGRTATLTGSSTNGLTHTFSYAVVAGDIGSTTASVTTGNFNLNGGTAYEVADDGSVKALTAPIAVGGSLASKTGITIQA